MTTFGDHFYGINGFRVLTRRAEAGRDTLRQIASYLTGRVSLEETYAKGLLGLNRGAESHQHDDGIDDGSFLKSFRVIQAEAEYMGRQHHQFQAIIATTMHKRITSLEVKLHKAQSKLVSNTNKVISEMTSLKKQYRKSNDRYLRSMYAAQVAARAVSQNSEPTETPKLEEKSAAARRVADTATEDYRDVVARINEYHKVYDNTLSTALQEFQQMEEERIRTIKEVMGQYKDFHQILQVGMNESCDRIGASVDKIDDVADLTELMQKRGTGNERGIPLQFEEYTEQAYMATLSKSGLRAATIVQSPENRPERAGYLRKRGHLVKNWKQRWFKLVGAALYYFTDDSSEEPIQGIPLMGASVEVADQKVKKGEEPTCFMIDTHSKKYYMKAATPAEMQDWISAIHQAQGRREGWQRGTELKRKLDPSKPSGASNMPEVIAVHPFPGSAENGELSFEVGEIITVTSVEDPGWWEGEVGSRSGIFPSNYVKIYTGEPVAAPVEAPAEAQPMEVVPDVVPPVEAPVEAGVPPPMDAGVPPPMDAGVPPPMEVGVPPAEETVSPYEQEEAVLEQKPDTAAAGATYKALWDFPGAEEGELPFSTGDFIQVTNQDDAGWWYGTFNGKDGMFPANYVEQV